jgi:hypothetical protein
VKRISEFVATCFHDASNRLLRFKFPVPPVYGRLLLGTLVVCAIGKVGEFAVFPLGTILVPLFMIERCRVRNRPHRNLAV